MKSLAKNLFLGLTLAGFSVGLLASVSPNKQAGAVTAADWRAGRIIDDAVFTNKNAMTASEVQAFLNAKVPACDTWGTKLISGGGQTRAQWAAANGKQAPPYTCLRDFWEVPKLNPGAGLPANNYGGAPVPNGGKSAAQIIWDAAQRYNISPKVLLVTIQKESAGPLTVDDWPFLSQYTYAMGAHCPDGPGGAQCDSNYGGFSIQINESARLFRYYLDNMTQAWWPYKKPYQNNFILWNVTYSGCGGGNVFIETMATAALYTYTPYQPNQASLNNMYGTGDGCSAYGNRNFWRIYSDWFGKTIVAEDVWYGWRDTSIDNTGDMAAVPIILTQKPTANVAVTFKTSDPSRAIIVRNRTLTFTPDNWNKMGVHTVFVQGINGGGSSRGFNLEVESVSSSDDRYGHTPVGYFSKQKMYWLNRSERAVNRFYNASLDQHAYSGSATEKAALVSAGYTDEGAVLYQCVGTTETPLGVNNTLGIAGSMVDPLVAHDDDTVPAIMLSNRLGSVDSFLLRRSDNNTVLTSSAGERDYAMTIGYSWVATFETCKSTDTQVYRLFHPSRGHFYTLSEGERWAAFIGGYTYEGAGWYMQSGGTIPVYRLHRTIKGSYFYTTSNSEKTSAQSQGFTYEGVAFSLASGGTSPIYRSYSPSAGTHFFTPILAEKNAASNFGFNFEGTAFNIKN